MTQHKTVWKLSISIKPIQFPGIFLSQSTSLKFPEFFLAGKEKEMDGNPTCFLISITSFFNEMCRFCFSWMFAKDGAYLGKGWALHPRLVLDDLCAPLEDHFNVLGAELGRFVIVIHDGAIGSTSQEIFNLLLGQGLLLYKKMTDKLASAGYSELLRYQVLWALLTYYISARTG